MARRAVPLPAFCQPAIGRAGNGEHYNAEAHDDGVLAGWPVPRGSRLWLLTTGEMLTLWPPGELVLDGVAYRGGDAIKFHEGAPWRGTLARDTTLWGVPCRGDAVLEIHRAGGPPYVQRATLARDARVDGVECVAGTEIHRAARNVLDAFTPARDVTVSGVRCAGGGAVRMWMGRVSFATLAAEASIDNVPCAAGKPVQFGLKGLNHATLARRWFADGVALREGTVVTGELALGRIASGTLDEDAEVDGIWCAAGTLIKREGRGRVCHGTLLHPTVIDGFPCAEGTVFERSGVREYTLSRPHTIRGIGFDAGDRVVIDDYDDWDAGVPFVTLATPRVVCGREFPAGSVVSVDGWIRRRVTVKLGALAVIDGEMLHEGSHVAFDRASRIAYLRRAPKPAQPYR